MLNKEVLEEIYFNYYKKLTNYAFVLVRNISDAEDVVQEVFLKLPRIFNTYNPKKGSFDSWIFKVVKNEANSIIEKRSINLTDEVESNYSKYFFDSVTLIDLKSLLSYREFEYITLSFVYKFKSKEILCIMNISYSTLKRIKKEAFKKIKVYIKS